MSSSTKAIFGKRALGIVFAEDYIEWAVKMLVQGYDSPNLRILAGLDQRSSVFEVENYFLRSIKELNIEEVNSEAAVRAYACETAQHIINGQFVSTRQAIQAMYQIWLATDYDPDYALWCELDDTLDSPLAGGVPYYYPSATLENLDEIVTQEAKGFIAKMSS